MLNDTFLNEDNFIILSAKAYRNSNCVTLDMFHDDLKHIKYIKRLLNRYKETGELKERLILNHITILYNLFGLWATRMLFFKIDKQNYSALKTFLTYLNYMPEIIHDDENESYLQNQDIELDENIKKILEHV